MVAGEHDIRPTCLSDLPHDDAIQNHVLHYLGCIPIGQRNKFYKEATKKLQGAFDTEIHRIQYLRVLLAKDEEARELVHNLLTSQAAWKGSEVYKAGLKDVKNWRQGATNVVEQQATRSPDVPADPSEGGIQGGSGNPPKQGETVSDYQPEKDFNLHIIEFEDDDHQEDGSEGSRPVQSKHQVSDRKVKIHDILEDRVKIRI
jgi:hypothetical protein